MQVYSKYKEYEVLLL